jgi:hypothetical protein
MLAEAFCTISKRSGLICFETSVGTPPNAVLGPTFLVIKFKAFCSSSDSFLSCFILSSCAFLAALAFLFISSISSLLKTDALAAVSFNFRP